MKLLDYLFIENTDNIQNKFCKYYNTELRWDSEFNWDFLPSRKIDKSAIIIALVEISY